MNDICFSFSWLFEDQQRLPVLNTGKVHEAGAGRDREVVGFYRQAGHQHIW